MTYEERMQNLCVNIRRLRKESGLNQKEMARTLGVGVRTLSTLENGIVPPRLRYPFLLRAAKYFNITTDELFWPVEE